MRSSPKASTDWDVFTERLFDQSRFAIKLGLENIRRALEAEGNPQNKWKNIIVGGTNGKGQTSSVLSNILEEHGLKVGLFTSPHLIEFRERFRIDGVPTSRETVLEIGQYVLKTYSEGDIILTFFEMCVLIGVLIFKERGVDVAVMEVGLGGRLDAVNAIDPVLVLITNIGLDHQAYLGTTIEEIAAEKLALIRKEVPTVISPQTYPGLLNQDTPNVRFIEKHVNDFRENNIKTAQEGARIFLENDHDENLSQRAISQSRWPGRADKIELTGKGGDVFNVIVDAAHNPLGLKSFLKTCASDMFDVVIFGAMRDKDLEKMGEYLSALNKPIWGVSVNSERAANEAELRKWIPLSRFGSLDDMLAEAPKALVCGSIYLLGEVFVWGGLEVEDLAIRY